MKHTVLVLLAIMCARADAQQQVFVQGASPAGAVGPPGSCQIPWFSQTSTTMPVARGVEPLTFTIPPDLSLTWDFYVPSPLTCSRAESFPTYSRSAIIQLANYSAHHGVFIARRGGASVTAADPPTGAGCSSSHSTSVSTSQLRVIDPYGCLPDGTPVVVRYAHRLRSYATVAAFGRRGTAADEAKVTWSCSSNGNGLVGEKHVDGRDGYLRNDPAPNGVFEYTLNRTVGGAPFTDLMRVIATTFARADGWNLIPGVPDTGEFDIVIAMEWEGGSITDPAGNPIRHLALIDAQGRVFIAADDPGCNPADLACPFGVLDIDDINAFAIAFANLQPTGDLNNDGVFDLGDIVVFVGNFHAGCP